MRNLYIAVRYRQRCYYHSEICWKLITFKEIIKCREVFPAVEIKFRKENQVLSDEDTELEKEHYVGSQETGNQQA